MNEIEKLDSNEQRLGWQRMKSLMEIMKKQDWMKIMIVVYDEFDGNNEEIGLDQDYDCSL